MFRTKNQLLTLSPEHWATANGASSCAARKGLAIDAAEKEMALAAGAIIPEDKFALHDFEFPGEFYGDIKSTKGKWVSMSMREFEFAFELYKKGIELFYVLYEQCNQLNDYLYLGCVSFRMIYARSLFKTSQFYVPTKQPDGSWKDEQSMYFEVAKSMPYWEK